MKTSEKLKSKGFVTCNGCGQIVLEKDVTCKWCYNNIKTGKKPVKRTVKKKIEE